MTSPTSPEPPKTNRPDALRLAVAVAVWFFAVYHFSDNKADPDLWGHVLYGQRALLLGWVEKADPFSWTVPGHAWINHETLAEIAMGAAHLLAGGVGLLLLKMAVGLGTFGLALRTGSKGLDWPARGAAWSVAVLAVTEIAWGFAPRPQIFTALGLAILLWMLREMHGSRLRLAWFLPLLSLVWINTHGGALAGILILGLAAGASFLEGLVRKEPALRKTGLVCAATFIVSTAVLLLNPWGWRLPAWLIESVLYVRPQIDEWNAAGLGMDHLPAVLLAVVTGIALFAARKQVRWWEAGVLVLLAYMSYKHARHIPLFAISALALLPRYLAEAGSSLGEQTERLRIAFSQPGTRRVAAAGLWVVALGCAVATVGLRKGTFQSIEFARDEYPVGAMRFLRDAHVRGNLVPFFDWAQEAIWELPEMRVSFDGRLDTSYPRSVIDAHWDFYNGRPWNTAIIDLNRADAVMVPRRLACIEAVGSRPDWRAVYADPLAVVFVRRPERFPALAGLTAPVQRGPEVVAGFEPFPAHPSATVRRELIRSASRD